MELTKKQHFIWKEYLRNWSNEKDQIFCSFKKLTPKLTSLDNVANERYFYEIKEINDLEREFLISLINKNLPEEIIHLLTKQIDLYNSMFLFKNLSNVQNEIIENFNKQAEENIQGSIESDGILFLNNIKNDNLSFCLKEENLVNFYVFIFMQYFRTKKIYDDIVKNQSHDLNSFNFENVFNPARHILSCNEAFYLALNNYNVILLNNTTSQEFITADQPVINIHANYSLLNKQVDKMELYYPISPKIAILITNDKKYEKINKISLELYDINNYNKMIINASQMQIYCSKLNSLDNYNLNKILH